MASIPKIEDCTFRGVWDPKEAARPEGYDYADIVVSLDNRLFVSMVNDNNVNPRNNPDGESVWCEVKR